MDGILKNWLNGGALPQDFYELLNKPRFCTDRDALILAAKNGHATLQSYEKRAKGAIGARARELQRLMGEAYLTFSKDESWRLYDERLRNQLKKPSTVTAPDPPAEQRQSAATSDSTEQPGNQQRSDQGSGIGSRTNAVDTATEPTSNEPSTETTADTGPKFTPRSKRIPKTSSRPSSRRRAARARESVSTPPADPPTSHSSATDHISTDEPLEPAPAIARKRSRKPKPQRAREFETKKPSISTRIPTGVPLLLLVAAVSALAVFFGGAILALALGGFSSPQVRDALFIPIQKARHFRVSIDNSIDHPDSFFGKQPEPASIAFGSEQTIG
jgi:hypothetical protein